MLVIITGTWLVKILLLGTSEQSNSFSRWRNNKSQERN